GVSGGADSVALLELCVRELVPRFGCSLHAVHVNHGLRADAEADQRFVEALCAARGVPLDVALLAPETRPRRQSTEMWGREQRYTHFARVKARVGAHHVLTAHHRDDVVETVCLRLERGTGLTGLSGIPFARAGGVVRPLLPVPREELRTWLRALGTSWREDESNADTRIPRNRVRLRLLPQWRAADAEVDARLYRIARQVTRLLPAWDQWQQEQYPAATVRVHGGIPLEWLRSGLDATLLRALLRILGVARPGPELAAEILRQAVAREPVSVNVRASETTLLTSQNGLLVAIRSVFKRKRDEEGE
ncbi:MAG TPA: tRNA lysidine(34) synthetase TilS, partial [Fibrobacteria bacterium]|nr:tRNA lysidine(34) synthetase TilS [Fibrobacteria bacterium]